VALNKYLLRSTIAGSLGGLLFGFDTAVIAGTTHALSGRFSLTPNHLGFTVAIALWGTVLGTIAAGSLGQRIGSRASLRIMAFLYLVSALGCAFAWSWDSLLTARFVGGLGIGGSSVLGPVYIAELAPASFRGRLVGLFQINVVIGILLAYLSNFLIATLHLGATEWRWQLGVAALPAALFLLMLAGIPHSPRWLVTQERIPEALNTLAAIGVPDSEATLKEIEESFRLDQQKRTKRLLQRRYKAPILLATAIAAFNQLSGINAILYYLNDIFILAGFSRVSGSLQAVIIGIVNLVATVLAMTLIDKIGRKMLLLYGCGGMTLCLSGVATILATGKFQRVLIIALTGYIASFALSSGAVIWVYMSEILPTSIRVKGQAMGSAVLWIINGIISQAFPSLAAKSASLPFIFFAIMMATQFVVTWFLFPETKGVSLEDLQKKLRIADA
jgi:sugar porter (SP) family MFS transporter